MTFSSIDCRVSIPDLSVEIVVYILERLFVMLPRITDAEAQRKSLETRDSSPCSSLTKSESESMATDLCIEDGCKAAGMASLRSFDNLVLSCKGQINENLRACKILEYHQLYVAE